MRRHASRGAPDPIIRRACDHSLVSVVYTRDWRFRGAVFRVTLFTPR